MKKKKILLLTALLALLLTAPMYGAYADLIAEPPHISHFFDAHADECEYLYEFYEAKESVQVYLAPDNDYLLDTLEKGDVREVVAVYIADDEVWGMVETNEYGYPDEEGVMWAYFEPLYGWLSMAEMAEWGASAASSAEAEVSPSPAPSPSSGGTEAPSPSPAVVPGSAMPLWQILLVVAAVAVLAVAAVLLVLRQRSKKS